MQIYIRRDNQDFGPYSREVVLEYVKQGVFESMDPACYAGMSEWKTVGELLGINGAGKTRRGTTPRSAAHITEFNPGSLPEPPPVLPERRMRRQAGSNRGPMIALNVTLIVIAVVFGMMRTSTGRRVIRHGLLAVSAGLAHLAGAPVFTGEPAPSPGAFVAKASSPAPSVAGQPSAVVAAASPVATASSSVPVAVSSPVASPAVATAPAASPAAAISPEASASPAMAATDNAPDDSAPSPAPAASAPPAPAASAASPAPVAVTTPPPPPKPFDPADLAGNPSAWPKKLHLKQAVEFPALYNGQVVGSVTAPAGTAVTLRDIQGGQLTVDYQGGTQKIPWTLTDLEQAAAKVAATPASSGGPPTTATPPTSSTPPTTATPPTSSSPPTTSAPPDTSAQPPSDGN